MIERDFRPRSRLIPSARSTIQNNQQHISPHIAHQLLERHGLSEDGVRELGVELHRAVAVRDGLLVPQDHHVRGRPVAVQCRHRHRVERLLLFSRSPWSLFSFLVVLLLLLQARLYALGVYGDGSTVVPCLTA